MDIARLPRHAGGDGARELERNLVRIADAVNATVVIHGFLDVAAPPYRFAPLLSVTDEFNGGEELTGASAFGSPIEFALPLRTGEDAAQNRVRRAGGGHVPARGRGRSRLAGGACRGQGGLQLLAAEAYSLPVTW